MKALYWNVYIGHNPNDVLKELRDMIGETRPDLIGLGEASNCFDVVQRIKGYRVFAIKETYQGEGDTIVLARDGVKLRHWHWMKMRKWWTGPKHGLKQGPKRYWSGRVSEDGVTYRVSFGHWPFNTAVAETEDRVAKWFGVAAPGRASAHIGDLNMKPEEVTKYVRRFRGSHVGVFLDQCMFKNCEVTARNLGKRGSDHPAVLFTITKRARIRNAIRRLLRLDRPVPVV